MSNHLCIISPSLKIGGIQRALSELANYYVSKGLTVTFITCFSVTPLYNLDERVQLIDHGKKRGQNGSLLNKLAFYAFLIKFVRRKVKELKPDAVLTFGDIMGPFVLGALKGVKIPIYIGDRTSPDYKFKFPVQQLKNYLYPASTGYFAQTTKAADYRRKQFGNSLNITVVPNGIRNVQKYDKVREKMILYVGRFAWEKAPDRLIKAFAEINNNNWTLEMAGDGPLLSKMKALAKDLSIEDRITFHGEVKNVDMLFSKASVYVLPSVLEGFPNALCEAMSAGLPVVCFDTIPFEDILTDDFDGLVVKSNDIAALTQKLDELINDPLKRETLGKNAQMINERLNIERAAKIIYKEIFKSELQ